MIPLPHHYRVNAEGGPNGAVKLSSEGLPDLLSASPVEFGGAGDLWSPESLITASVIGCFILTFRAVARASKFDWIRLDCEAEGLLERVEGVTRFTRFVLRPRLELDAAADSERGARLLEKAEKSCLITASLRAATLLEPTVSVVRPSSQH
jgi:organic hydroperoxide reductase OsmC/OhrA